MRELIIVCYVDQCLLNNMYRQSKRQITDNYRVGLPASMANSLLFILFLSCKIRNKIKYTGKNPTYAQAQIKLFAHNTVLCES